MKEFRYDGGALIGNAWYTYDVSVISETCKSIVQRAASEQGYAAKTRHKEKMDKLGDWTTPPNRFAPIVLETEGYIHPDSEKFLRTLAGLALSKGVCYSLEGHEDEDVSKLLLKWNSSLAQALQRGNFLEVLFYARHVAAHFDAQHGTGGVHHPPKDSFHTFERHSYLVDEVM